MIDGEVKDGKIYRFFAYEALVPDPPAVEEDKKIVKTHKKASFLETFFFN